MSLEPLVRERAVNALGRSGRGSYPMIEPFCASLFRFASDEGSRVRLAFVRPYVEQPWQISEIDENRVVRIHCLGAIRTAGLKKWKRGRSTHDNNRIWKTK